MTPQDMNDSKSVNEDQGSEKQFVSQLNHRYEVEDSLDIHTCKNRTDLDIFY